MQTVLAIFWHVIMALVGALGFGALMMGGLVLACGCGLFGSTWCYRTWRARRSRSE